MGDFQAIAQQFVEFYYKTFDADRTHLAPLYRDKSMMTWESAPFLGTGNIVEKLTSLPFQKVEHAAATVDAQPANEQGGIMVMVTGALKFDEQQQAMSFVQNDVFRLVYPAH